MPASDASRRRVGLLAAACLATVLGVTLAVTSRSRSQGPVRAELADAPVPAVPPAAVVAAPDDDAGRTAIATEPAVVLSGVAGDRAAGTSVSRPGAEEEIEAGDLLVRVVGDCADIGLTLEVSLAPATPRFRTDWKARAVARLANQNVRSLSGTVVELGRLREKRIEGLGAVPYTLRLKRGDLLVGFAEVEVAACAVTPVTIACSAPPVGHLVDVEGEIVLGEGWERTPFDLRLEPRLSTLSSTAARTVRPGLEPDPLRADVWHFRAEAIPTGDWQLSLGDPPLAREVAVQPPSPSRLTVDVGPAGRLVVEIRDARTDAPRDDWRLAYWPGGRRGKHDGFEPDWIGPGRWEVVAPRGRVVVQAVGPRFESSTGTFTVRAEDATATLRVGASGD